MAELVTKMEVIKSNVHALMTCHRLVYTGLSFCHASGCWIAGKPELYAPMAILYAVLAVRG